MRAKQTLRYSVLIAALAALGTAAAAYVLIQERAPVPFQNIYDVNVELTYVGGVQPGLGQPVNVAGVRVGQIVGDTLASDGDALVTLQLERSSVPRLYANASATLAPITPLGDMEMNLDPGRPPAPALAAGATIGAGQSSSPVPLSNLLASLDGDTRDFMTSMLASFEQGTKGRGPDIRKALLALGPTTAELRQITTALAQRRVDLANLVHNLAVVTRAASQDGQLAGLVQAGDATLNALAAQDAPLRQSIADLPGTLRSAQATLSHAATFADQLGPTLSSLLPAVSRLPSTLNTLGRFSRVTSSSFAQQIRPLVRQAQPLVRKLGPATTRLRAIAPSMTSVFQVLNYLFNELAYVPGGNDQGFLFWASWFFHNANSTFSLGDAHGSIGGASFYTSCSQLTNALGTETKLIALITGIASLCSGK